MGYLDGKVDRGHRCGPRHRAGRGPARRGRGRQRRRQRLRGDHGRHASRPARWPTRSSQEIRPTGGTAVAVADSVADMAGGERIVATARRAVRPIDGVVCVAGILRERMLFNMSEDEWDPVIDTHLKGTFTVFRAAAARMTRAEVGLARRLHLGRLRRQSWRRPTTRRPRVASSPSCARRPPACTATA